MAVGFLLISPTISMPNLNQRQSNFCTVEQDWACDTNDNPCCTDGTHLAHCVIDSMTDGHGMFVIDFCSLGCSRLSDTNAICKGS